MNAINPAPSTASVGSDQRPYEPSMEEILASIRRIIADDQSTPGRGSLRDMPAFRSEPRALPVGDAPAPAQPPALAAAPAAESEVSLKTYPATGSQDDPATPQGPVPDLPAAAPTPIHPAVPTEREPLHAAPAMAEPEHASEKHAADMPVAHSPVVHHPHDVESHRDEPHEAWAPRMQQAAPSQAAPSLAEPGPVHAVETEDESDPYFDPPIERDEPLPAAETPAGLFSAHTTQSLSTAFNVLAATRLADNSEELLGLARDMIRPLLKTWLDDNLPSMVERMVRAEIERVARGGR